MALRNQEDRRLVPAQVLAATLGIRTSDLRREALGGRLPHVRVGESGILFDSEVVTQLLLDRAKDAQEKETSE